MTSLLKYGLRGGTRVASRWQAGRSPIIGAMSTQSEKMGSGTRCRPIPDDLGRALLEVLGTWRPQAISLHDSAGNTLWLSAGSIGPDEHSFVVSALDV